MVKKATKKQAKKTSSAGMHMMSDSKMPMKDKEMDSMMSQELKARYPSMVKKASPKRKK